MPIAYICLSGQLGSGKSSICTFLQERYGYTVFSTGALHRHIAKEKGVSTLDFNAEITSDSTVDIMIDDALRSFAAENRGTNVIFDSRMAWHFVPDAFKVFLLVSAKEAARRVFHGRNLVEESYDSEEKAIADLIKRRSLENMRFLKFYDVDCDDFHHYDLILDTTRLSVEQTSEWIYRSLSAYPSTGSFPQCFLAPENVLLSKVDFVELEKDTTEIAVQYFMDRFQTQQPVSPILVVKRGDHLQVVDGHARVAAAVRLQLPTVAATIVS